MPMAAFDAIVLAGGRSRRLDGRTKTTELVGGVPVLTRVTSALSAAGCVVVVGDPSGAGRADIVTREDPAGGGPVAGVAAGLVHVAGGLVAIVAGDLPFLSTAAVQRLVDALGSADVAVAVDEDGNDQLLLAVWRTTALHRSVYALDHVHNARIRDLFAERSVSRVTFTDFPPPWWDCDTPDQLELAREWAAKESA